MIDKLVSNKKLDTEYNDTLKFDLESVEEEFLFNKIVSYDNEALTSDLNSIYKNVIDNNIVIIKKAISTDVSKQIIQNLHSIGTTTPTNFFKLKEDIPNFHSINDENVLAKIKMKVHGYYFFSWNKQSDYFFDKIQNVSNAFFELGGRNRSFVKNTTQDDYLFRLQIFHYPSGGGYTVVHSDPPGLVKVTPILSLTEKGKDYHSGGAFLYNKSKEKILVDDIVRQGDLVLFYPKMFHGVDPIDPSQETKWNSSIGRWVVLFNILPSLRNS